MATERRKNLTFLRRLAPAFLAACLLGAPFLAHASPPPPVPPIADANRYESFNLTSATSSVQVNFPVFGDCTDIIVQLNGVPLVLNTDFTCASASRGSSLSLLPLPITDLVVTFSTTPTADLPNGAPSSGLLEVFGAWHPRDLVQGTAPGINRREFNQSVSELIAGMRELYGGMPAGSLRGNPTGTDGANGQNFSVANLPQATACNPNSDFLLKYDAATGQLQRATCGQVANSSGGVAGVSSIGGLVGAVGLGAGLGVDTNKNLALQPASPSTIGGVTYPLSTAGVNFTPTGTGAATRALSAVLSEFEVSIVDFGASTAAADNTAAIQNAINASASVLVPCGDFITGDLTFPAGGTALRGQQRQCAILKWKAGQTGGNWLVFGTGATAAASSIRDLTLDGQGGGQSAGTGYAIVVNNIYYFLLDRVSLQNLYASAVYIGDATANQNYTTGADIRSTSIANWGLGGSGNAISVGQYVYDISIGPMVDIYGGPASPAEGNAAIDVHASNYVRIIDDNIDGNGTQIYLNSVTFSQIVGNSIHCGAECSDGVDLVGAVGTLVVGNQFYALEANSIHLLSSANHNTICGNSILAGSPPTMPSHGILEDAGATPNVYCGARPSEGNVISGTFAAAPYSINGPTASTGMAAVSGCSGGACTDSTDLAGVATLGTSVTSAALTFGAPFSSAPACVVTSSNAGIGVAASPSTTGLTITTSASVSGLIVNYLCSGRR